MGEPNPVLFLDIDGVLNCCGRDRVSFHPDKVALLKRILDTVPTDVVLSSTWRMFTEQRYEVAMMLQSIGHKLKSQTPEGKTLDSGLVVGMPRHEEIKAWLRNRQWDGVFVVLDDDVFPADFLPENLVATERYTGLTPELADDVIRKLSAPCAPAQSPPESSPQ